LTSDILEYLEVLLPKYRDDMEYVARNLKEEYEK
jgi:hypothetical protein